MSSNPNTADISNYLRLLFAEGSDVFLKDYKRLADFFPALVFVLDADKKKLAYTNKQFNTLLGYNDNELTDLEEDLDTIIFSDDIESFKVELQKCYDLKDEESHSYKNRLNHKEGNWLYFKTKATVLRRDANGKPEALLFVSEDITEQQKSFDELERTKQLISETEKMHRFGMYSYDFATDTFNWSDGVYKLFEVDRASNPSPNYAFFRNFIVEEDSERMEDIKKNISPDTTEYENIFSIKTSNGDLKILLDIVKVLRNDNGEIIKYLGSLRDITKERLYERELQKNIKDLYSSNRELEEFAYVASHDMQEPLRKITTFSTRLYDKFSNQLGEEGKTYLERMNVAANNMRILIENLLEISRTSREEHPFRKTDLNKIVKAAISELELSIEENNVQIKVDPHLPTVDGVSALMHQLFCNLLNNAIKFRSKEQSRISITSSVIDKHERERLLLPEKVFYKIAVKDNGIGFEQEYAEKVFQIFQRLHGKAEYPGSGIGLSICKKIVDKHNGIIYAESQLGKGTTFFIILPEKQ
ncbi:MAG: ATP-binding protein [Bacteroidota bacterium]